MTNFDYSDPSNLFINGGVASPPLELRGCAVPTCGMRYASVATSKASWLKEFETPAGRRGLTWPQT